MKKSTFGAMTITLGLVCGEAMALDVQAIYTAGPNPAPAGTTYDPSIHTRALTLAEQAAFEEAAVIWERHIRDPIDVVIEVYFENVPASAIANVSELIAARPLANSAVGAILQNPAQQPLAYQFFMHRLKKKNAQKQGKVDVIAHLPNHGQINLDLPQNMDPGFQPFGVLASSALWSALGTDLKPIAGFALDGRVRFNPLVSWDLDRSDGIGSGEIPWDSPGFRLDDPSTWPPGFPQTIPFLFQSDFVGTALHEIGHVLGVLSSRDFINEVGYGNTPWIFQTITPMDLFTLREDRLHELNKRSDFRFAQRKIREEGDGTQASLEVGNAVFVHDIIKNQGPSYTLMSGGRLGDGTQASHLRGWRRWVFNQGFIVAAEFPFGLNFRPQMAPGGLPNRLGDLTSADLAVLDAIGFDVDYAGLALPGAGKISASADEAVDELASWGLAVAGQEHQIEEGPAQSFAPLP